MCNAALAYKSDPDVKGDEKLEVFSDTCTVEKTVGWKARNNDFLWSMDEEPHTSRRKEIMMKHPEVKKLFGYAWETKWIVLLLVALQIGAAYYLRDMTWTWQFFVASYIIGGTANQALFLAIHEITHNLGFKKYWHNKAFNCFANLPIGLPYCAAFRGYHLEHHKYQGVDGIDTDLPTRIEGLFFTNVLSKLFFATCQILFYAIRPMLIKRQSFTNWHAINWVVQFSFNIAVFKLFGLGPLWYFLTSDFMAGSLHPCASHFIAEHYVFVGECETYV